jgi:hypothetical protein
MNKSLRARGRESSRKTYYGFRLSVIPGRASSARTRNPDTVRWLLDSGSTRRRVSRNDAQEDAVTNGAAKKEPPLPAALKLITGRRQTEWTGATRCPNKDDLSHIRESLIDRKRTICFRVCLPCRPMAEFLTACPGHCRVPDAVQRSSRCSAEPGPYRIEASLPGLTRQSIFFGKTLAKIDGCAGQARA